jgi:hypothetical protein
MRPAIVLTDRKFFVAPELFTVGCGELVLRALLAAGCITLEIVSGHEEHEEKSQRSTPSILRVLRALRGEIGLRLATLRSFAFFRGHRFPLLADSRRDAWISRSRQPVFIFSKAVLAGIRRY